MMQPDRDEQHGEDPEVHNAPETPEARRGRLLGQGIALGTGLGVAFGMLLGLLFFDNVMFGLPIGLCLGIGIGAVAGSQRAAAAEHAQQDEPAQPETGSPRVAHTQVRQFDDPGGVR